MSTSDERLARRASTMPETVNAADVTSWSDEVDVLVIGFGIAGGCAAVSAAAAGARVLVLERAAAAGGTSAMAGGHFYLGGGTAVQQATGHDDCPEEMYKYLVAVSREPEHDKIRAYCDGSVEHFNWLEDLGFQFERSYYPGKVVVPPGTEGLSYTGNEKVWPFMRAGQARAARPLGAGARRAGRRRDGHRPARQAGRRARRGDPLRDRCDQPGRRRRCGGRRQLEALHRDRCDQGQGGDHRRGRFRDEPGDGRRAHAGAGAEAAHQAPRRGGALHPGQPQRRRTGHPTGCLGGRRRQEPGPDVHHRRRISAGDPAHRHHRQQRGPALRRRGLLSLTHVGLRAGTTGSGGLPRSSTRRTRKCLRCR